jgi:hypothetical protein
MPRFSHCVASGHVGLWQGHLTDATLCENKGTPEKSPGRPGLFSEAHFSMSDEQCPARVMPGSRPFAPLSNGFAAHARFGY